MVDVPHSLGNRLPVPEPSGFPERASRHRAVLWQEIRANSCKRRTARSSRSKDSSSLSQTPPLRGLTGGLLMVAITMFSAISEVVTGRAGFSAMILYLAGLLAQFRLVYERARSRKIAFGYHRLSPAPPASCVSRPSPGPTWETPLRKGTRRVTSSSAYPMLGRLTAITAFLPTMVPHSATHRGGVRRGRSRSGGLDPRPRQP